MLEIVTFGSSSAGNGYLLKDGDSHLMLEAGINPKKIKVDWSKVEGVLMTHEHKDHSKYIQQIIGRTAIKVYCTQGTANFIDIPIHRMTVIKAKQGFKIQNWHILPFDVQHDAAEPVGFLIQTPSAKKVLFATDTYYIKYKFKGITHAMVECNYSFETVEKLFESGEIDKKRKNRLLTSHFELSNVIQFFQANDWSELEEVHLLHLSDSNSNEDEFKQKITEVTGVPVYIA